MKINAVFNENGWQLNLLPETLAEKRMVGAVLDPQSDAGEIVSSLVKAELRFDGHWTHKAVQSIRLTVHRDHAKQE